jgi:hypothetical protein
MMVKAGETFSNLKDFSQEADDISSSAFGPLPLLRPIHKRLWFPSHVWG